MKFKAIIYYENSCIEEIIDIQCNNIKEAKEKCEEIKNKDKNTINNLKLKNIYNSKIIKDCRIHPSP